MPFLVLNDVHPQSITDIIAEGKDVFSRAKMMPTQNPSLTSWQRGKMPFSCENDAHPKIVTNIMAEGKYVFSRAKMMHTQNLSLTS